MIQSPSEKRALFRSHLWDVMHHGKGRLGHIFNFLSLILILLSGALVPLQFLPGYARFDTIVMWMEIIVVSLFTVDYLLRIFAAPSRLRYIFSFFGIVDLLSIVPFYSGIFGTEYIRLLRLVRFLRIGEIEPAASVDEEEAMQKEVGLLEGEHVEYVISKHPAFLFLGSIPSLVAITFGLGILFASQNPVSIAAAVALFLFALVFLWKAWLDYGYDVIYLTNFRLIFHNQHILGRHINQIGYASITNVKPFYPNILSYVLRYGSLVIDTAAEHPGQIGLHMVRKHEKAAHMIMQKGFAQKAQAQSHGQEQAPVAPTSF